MANTDHLGRLKDGVEAWNQWRKQNPSVHPDLRKADLLEARLSQANLANADLFEANLRHADLSGANLNEGCLAAATLAQANLRGAHLVRANLNNADLNWADLRGADLSFAELQNASLIRADLREKANLSMAKAARAFLMEAQLSEAILRDANLSMVNLIKADLRAADLSGAKLDAGLLLETNFEDANLSACSVYGISAWKVRLTGAIQSNLVITPDNESKIQVDDLEVAQFVYLLLNNKKIRNVIDTIGKKGVLILGRFTERKEVLEAIRSELRRLEYVPIVFDFERPSDRDFTETVMTLAGMSRFIIADITKPRSVPLELEATVPNYMIPFVPIIEAGERPFAMFQDLWKKYREWVLPPLKYDSVHRLVNVLDKAVVEPANERLLELRRRKTEEPVIRDAKDY